MDLIDSAIAPIVAKLDHSIEYLRAEAKEIKDELTIGYTQVARLQLEFDSKMNRLDSTIKSRETERARFLKGMEEKMDLVRKLGALNARKPRDTEELTNTFLEVVKINKIVNNDPDIQWLLTPEDKRRAAALASQTPEQGIRHQAYVTSQFQEMVRLNEESRRKVEAQTIPPLCLGSDEGSPPPSASSEMSSKEKPEVTSDCTTEDEEEEDEDVESRLLRVNRNTGEGEVDEGYSFSSSSSQPPPPSYPPPATVPVSTFAQHVDISTFTRPLYQVPDIIKIFPHKDIALAWQGMLEAYAECGNVHNRSVLNKIDVVRSTIGVIYNSTRNKGFPYNLAPRYWHLQVYLAPRGDTNILLTSPNFAYFLKVEKLAAQIKAFFDNPHETAIATTEALKAKYIQCSSKPQDPRKPVEAHRSKQPDHKEAEQHLFKSIIDLTTQPAEEEEVVSKRVRFTEPSYIRKYMEEENAKRNEPVVENDNLQVLSRACAVKTGEEEGREESVTQ